MRHPVDVNALHSAGLGYSRTGNVASITSPYPAPEEGGVEVVATVAVDGDEFEFFPERSASHRRVMSMLGLTQP